MKTLFIIRHAKSSWNFDLPDIDRPIGTRGRRDVVKIGKHLSLNEPTPQLILSSPASRALHTALFLADYWNYPEEDIQIHKGLYHSSAESTLQILSGLDDPDSVAIFGHNPGFTELANNFLKEYLDNLPTCGVIRMELDIEKWSQISRAKLYDHAMIFPKKLK